MIHSASPSFVLYNFVDFVAVFSHIYHITCQSSHQPTSDELYFTVYANYWQVVRAGHENDDVEFWNFTKWIFNKTQSFESSIFPEHQAMHVISHRVRSYR